MNVSSIKQTHSTQHDSNVNSINREQESVTVAYSSVESFYNHLMYSAMKQASVFAAIQLIFEVSELNGGKGLPENYMRKVKMHFIKKDRQQNEKHFSNNKVEKLERGNVVDGFSLLENQNPVCLKGNVDKGISNIETHFAGIEFHNKQREINRVANNEKLRKEMQKGYMSLLSESIECRV